MELSFSKGGLSYLQIEFQIREAGGAGLLTKFSNNMKNMLDTIFPGLN